jgi:hypothetical protein
MREPKPKVPRYRSGQRSSVLGDSGRPLPDMPAQEHPINPTLTSKQQRQRLAHNRGTNHTTRPTDEAGRF